MLKIKVYSQRYGHEQTPRTYNLYTIDELERFIEYDLGSDEHYVYKIECPDIPEDGLPHEPKTFECVPMLYHDPFIEFARGYLAPDA